MLEVIVNMVPSNVFSAMSNFELLPCIVFSIFFGIALTMIGKKAEPVLSVLDGALEAIYKGLSGNRQPLKNFFKAADQNLLKKAFLHLLQ